MGFDIMSLAKKAGKRRMITDPYGLIVCLAMDMDDPDICPKDNLKHEPDDRITGDCETCPYCRTLTEVLEKMKEKKLWYSTL